ncbi:hypothetical protein SAY87_020917 [Trapa incisa]|uniref:Uncharacterized protein n=1 Tax=Trapa incisa TaxID=236973 RepID=A0AAN7PQ82_9MYRT|nr:hypothetical protein SAY87_020917 [Trapa incisa]
MCGRNDSAKIQKQLTLKLIDCNGLPQEFDQPVRASEVLLQCPGCFICMFVKTGAPDGADLLPHVTLQVEVAHVPPGDVLSCYQAKAALRGSHGSDLQGNGDCYGLKNSESKNCSGEKKR